MFKGSLVLKPFVHPFIPALEDAEPCFFCIRDGEGFRNFGGVGSGDDLADRLFAEGAGGQFRAVKRAAQLKPAAAGFAGIPFENFVFVNRHAQIEQTEFLEGKPGLRSSPTVKVFAGGEAGDGDYQLDLVTPGIIPDEANSRKVMREILNRRMKARRRPLTTQRLTSRDGLASRGSCEREA